jgi:hypothetical protein
MPGRMARDDDEALGQPLPPAPLPRAASSVWRLLAMPRQSFATRGAIVPDTVSRIVLAAFATLRRPAVVRDLATLSTCAKVPPLVRRRGLLPSTSANSRLAALRRAAFDLAVICSCSGNIRQRTRGHGKGSDAG